MPIYNITAEDIEYNLTHLNQIVFEVTRKCNFRCEYCLFSGIYEGFNELSTESMDFTTVQTVLEYVFALWEKNERSISQKPIFIGFYGGEPLLNIDLIKETVSFVENRIGKERNIIFSMTTNAYFLDKHIDFITAHNFQLLISLDGNEKCDAFRKTIDGRPSFEKVFSNIALLYHTYPVFFKSHVNFNAVFNKNSSFEDIYTFFNSNFKKIPGIAQINTSDVTQLGKARFKNVFKSKRLSFIHSPNKREIDEKLFMSSPGANAMINYIFNHSGNVFSTYNDLFVDVSKANIVPTGTCLPFQKKMFITTNGDILQCEKISHTYALGQVVDGEVKLDLDKIAKAHNAFVNTFRKQCVKCKVRNSCPVCLLQKYPNGEITDRGCSNFYSEQKMKMYHMRSLDYLRFNPYLYERILNEVVVH